MKLLLVKSGGGTLILSGDLSRWTGTITDPGEGTDLVADPTRPTITIAAGVLRATGILNTVVLQTGGIFDDQTTAHGSNFYLKITGGLVTSNALADNAEDVVEPISHGVYAFNFNNSGTTGVSGSDMYLGAVGARIFSGAALAAGSGSTYRFGGGAPWNAVSTATLGGSGGYLQIATANVVTGANAVLIGDNGTYNGGTGLYGGLSSVEFTAAQNFSAGLTILGGTLQFTNSNQLGSPSVSANSIALDGGALNNGYNAILRYGPGTTTDLSARIGIVSGGTIDTGGNNVTFATAIGNFNSGTGGLNKIGSGTLTLSKANTFVGKTGVSQGTLSLDFNQTSATTNDVLNNGTGVILAGGTLTVNAKGATTVNNQRLVSTNLASGTNILSLTTSAAFSGAGASNLALGLITRSVGSGLNITAGTNYTLGTASGNVTTTTLNTNGILDGSIATSGTGLTGNTWAVSAATQSTNISWDGTTGSGTNKISIGSLVNGSQVSFSGAVPGGLSSTQAYYVVNSTVTDFQVALTPGGTPLTLSDVGTTATVNRSGAISGLAAASYLTTTTAGNTAANYLATSNVDVTSSPTLSGGITINSLRFSSTTTQTVTLTGSNVISSGGILISSAVGNVATVLSGGTIMGAPSLDLVVNNYDTSSSFTINSIIADNGGPTGLTKNGTGTLVVATATNTYSGQTVVNGGILTMDAQARYGSTTGFTLNGGQLNWTAGANLPKLFTLGLAGGTLNIVTGSTSTSQTVGTAGDLLLFQGTGARTLTLNSVADRKQTFNFIIGDNGGPTSLAISAGDTSIMALSASNTYTGITTINRGVLQLANAGALPGGVGGATLTSSNTGGGNLVFAATTTNRAILELTAASGGFYRSVGTGIDQVQWTGNGGFSNSTASNMVVNLGGSSAVMTWGSGGFVTNILQFGQAAANSLSSGAAIDFQNPINLGTAARTIDVSNGITTNVTGVDAILSAALTGGVGGGLTKTGAGVLKLTANNASGTNANSPTTVSGGFLILANTGSTDLTALPGSGAANRTLTVSSGGSVVLTGQTDLSSLLSRIVTSSTGSVSLDLSTNATFDLSAFSSLGLGAYSDVGGTPIYFGGSVILNANTYRFGSGQLGSGGAVGSAATTVQAAQNILVLTRTGILSDNGVTPRSAVFSSGNNYLTNYNNYTGGTTVTGTSGSAYASLGNDAALGTGLVTFTNSSSFIGSLNGDHVLSNNVKTSATGNFVVSGDLASDGIANAGALTYLGTVNLSSTQTIFGRTRNAIFLGDVTGPTTLTLSGTGAIYSFLTQPGGAVVKSYGALTTGDNATILIDDNRSLGAVNGTLTIGTSTLEVQPGFTTTVSFPAGRAVAITAGKTPVFNTPGDVLTIAGITAGGLYGNSSLTIGGTLSGGTTGGLTKIGLGTLTLQNASATAFTTGAAGLNIRSGTLVLDGATAGAAFFSGMSANTSIPLTLGSASGVFGAGGTLQITGTTNQNLGAAGGLSAVTVNPRSNTINLTQTMTLALGVVTRTTGSYLNFVVPTGSVTTSGTAVAGLLNGATTWNGDDWAQLSGGVISALPSASYTVLTGTNSAPTITSNASANYIIDATTTNNITLAAAGVLATPNYINTLKYSDPASRTIDVRTGATAGFLLLGGGNAAGGVNSAGGILVATGSGALTIGLAATPGTIMAGGTTTNTLGDLLIINNSSNPVTINSAIVTNNGTTGTTPVVIAGSGRVVLAGANTFTGGIFINSGVLEYSDGSAAAKNLGSPTAGATNINLNGGALRYTGSTSNNLIFGATINSFSVIDVPNAGGTINQTAQGLLGISGIAGILQKTGPGALTLSGATTDTNLSIEVVGGTLNLAKTSTSAVWAVDQTNGGAALIVDGGATAKLGGSGGNQISDTSSVVVKGGGTFDLNALSEGFDGLSGAGTVTNTATGTSTLTLGTNQNANIATSGLLAAMAGMAGTGLSNFIGVIQDGGSGRLTALAKSGAGTQVLGGTNVSTVASQNTYSGSTTINSGTLELAVLNALPFGVGKGDVTIFGNTVVNALIVPGALDIGGFNQAVNGLNSTTGGYVTNTVPLSWSGSAWTATTGTNTLNVGNADANGSFNGIFQDGLTIVPNPGVGAGTSAIGVLAVFKTGTGTLTLSGANTATGLLTVNQGEVDLNTTAANAWSGNVTVNTTGGSGTLKLLASNQIADTSIVTVAGGTFNLNAFNETISGLSLTTSGVVSGAGSVLTNNTSAYDLQSGLASVVLAGTVGVNKTTASVVTLSGSNTYAGVTNITLGTLKLGAAGDAINTPLGTTAAGTVVLSGGALDLNGFTLGTAEALTLNGVGVSGGGALTNSSATAVTYSGLLALGGDSSIVASSGDIVLSNLGTIIGAASGLTLDGTSTNSSLAAIIGTGSSGTLTKAGLGKWVLTGASTYTGVTTLTLGTLQIGNGTTVGSLAGGTAIGGTAGILAINHSDTVTLTNAMSGSITLSQIGTGTTVVSGAKTYTGATNVTAGRLTITGALDATAVTVSGGATLSGTGSIGAIAGGSVTVVGNAVPANAGTIDLVDGATGTLSIQSTSGATALFLGTGASKANLDFEIGVPNLSDTIAIGNAALLDATGGGATVNITGLTGYGVGTYDLFTFGTGLASGFGNLTLGATPSGGPGLVFSLVTDTGIAATDTKWQLAVTQAAAGATAYWRGNQSGVWNTITAGFTNWYSDQAGTVNTALPGAVTDVFFTADDATANFANALGADFTIKSLTFLGGANPAGAGSVTIGGANTLTILPATASTGLTVDASSAAHTISAKLALGSDQTWTNNSASLLTISGATVTAVDKNLTITGAGNVTISAALQTGAGTLTKSGTGQLTLSGANTYTGGTSLTGGVLNVSSAGALGATGTIGFSGGTLQYSTNNTTDYSNRFSTAAGQSYSIDTNGQNVEYATALTSSTGTLSKLGSGILTLTAANGYTGDTTVSNGTLSVNGSIAAGGSVTLTTSSGATLNGNGTINLAAGKQVTITAGTTLSAGADIDQVAVAGNNGNGVGQMTVTASSTTSTAMEWQPNSKLVFDFSNVPVSFGDDTNKGTDWDYFSVTGKLAITATSLAPITLNIDSWNLAKTSYGGPTSNLFDPNAPATNDIGAPWPVSYQWKWLTASDITDGISSLGTNASLDMFNVVDNRAVTGAAVNFGVLDGSSYVNNLNGGHFWVSSFENELYINYSAVPEPGSLLLVGLAGLGFAGYRRRKHRAMDVKESEFEEPAAPVDSEISE